MQYIAKAVFGGMMLFLGLSIDWLSSIGIGILVGFKLALLLPPDSAAWLVFLVIIAGGVVGFLPYAIYQEGVYAVTGFLAGGYLVAEYASMTLKAVSGTGLSGSFWLLFFIGAVIGLFILSLSKDWGLLLITSLLGSFLVVELFPRLSPFTSVLAVGGLFVAGSIIQTILMQFEKISGK